MIIKPRIGVIPLWDDAKQSLWMLPAYLDLLREQGALPIIFPLQCDHQDVVQLCGMCDGFLLTGGHDVDPAIYGQAPSPMCGEPCRVRDELEREVVDYAMERDMPILGICRGIQILNALLGGTLHQHLPDKPGSGVEHAMTPPYDRVQHQVSILDSTPLSAIVDAPSLGVNSYHHQAIDQLAPVLEPMAISQDGLVEAVYMPNKRFVQAFQWHPELNFRSEVSSCKIARAFVDSCR